MHIKDGLRRIICWGFGWRAVMVGGRGFGLGGVTVKDRAETDEEGMILG